MSADSSTNKAATKVVDLDGLTGDDVLQLDVSLHSQGGSVSSVSVPGDDTAEPPALDDKLTQLGLEGYVKSTGTTASRSMLGDVLTIEVGRREIKKSVSYTVPEDNTDFKCHKMSDLTDAFNAARPVETPVLNIEYSGFDLNFESHSFNGKIIDAMQDIAGMVYGTVNYDVTAKKYVIVSGDKDFAPSAGTKFSISIDDVVSYTRVTERNTETKNLGTELLRLLTELCKLKAGLLDVNDTQASAASGVKILKDKVHIDFGTKDGFKPIDVDIVVETAETSTTTTDGSGSSTTTTLTVWDEWDHLPTEDGKSKVKRELYYFKVETKEDFDPGTTGSKIKKRGLRTLESVNLYWRLKNFTSDVTNVYGRGYSYGIETQGLPSLYSWKKGISDASTAGTASDDYDDEYVKLFGVEVRALKMKSYDSGASATSYSKLYVPFLKFTLSTALLNAVKAQATSTGETVESLLLKQAYGANIEVMGTSNTTQLKYKGALDVHGRLISDAGQVLLVKKDVTENTGVGKGSLSSGTYFYAPVTGMDMNFINVTAVANDGKNKTDSTVTLVDETALKTNLLDAWDDLVEIATAKDMTPIAEYYDDSSEYYPKLLSAYSTATDSQGNKVKGAIIGIVYEDSTVFNADKEAKVPLTIASAASSADRTKKQYERKIKALESKLALLKKVVEHETGESVDSTVDDMIKDITNYLILSARAKNEEIQTMQTAKTAYDTAINSILQKFDYDSKVDVDKFTLTTIGGNTLPEVGQAIAIPSAFNATGSYYATSVRGSGVLYTIVAEKRLSKE